MLKENAAGRMAGMAKSSALMLANPQAHAKTGSKISAIIGANHHRAAGSATSIGTAKGFAGNTVAHLA